MATVVTLFSLVTDSAAQEIGSVRFLANFVPPSGGGYTAGCWGWTDTVSGREYALLGNSTGTSIVEITDVGNIVERDFIPGPGSNWREMMTWNNYAYVVTEGGGGVQIIDLSYLPDSAHLVRSFIYTLVVNSVAKTTNRAHSVHVRDGYLYLNGCAQWSPGGIVIFDLADPENPLFTGEYAGNYVHDSFVRNDTIFAAAIYGVGIEIIDATDKSAPQHLYTISYSGSGTHNIATTTDGRYVLSTDEINSTPKTLKIWDIATPPIFPMVAEYVGSPSAIVHNVFVRDTLAIMSYYTAGIRIINIADPENPVEVGGYDTRPLNESANYTGAWSVYPFFPSGKIIIGDMGNGMFVVDMNIAAPRVPSGVTVYSDYATPTGASLTWTDPTLTVGGDTLGPVEIRIYRDGVFLAAVPGGTGSYADAGLTQHQQYRYVIVAHSGGDSSAPVARTVYAGGAAAPRMPSGFRVIDLVDGTRLEWVNPAAQADGTPLNDLEAIEVERDGSPYIGIPAGAADTGAASSLTDTALGYHYFRIRARDSETPTYFSPWTQLQLGYGGITSSYSEDFETGKSSLLVSGTWDTTRALAGGGAASITDSPSGNYPNSTALTFVTPRFTVSPGAVLTFKHIAIMPGGDFGYVDITRNRGLSYITLRAYNGFAHPEWADSSADPGDWFSEVITLTAYEGDTVALRFRLLSNATVNADGWYVDDVAVGPLVGVDDDAAALPGSFALYQNTPNPFNPSTAIRFDLPARSDVRLAVYDVLGREVNLLFSGALEPGAHSITWDGRTGAGAQAGSGAYFYKIEATGVDGRRHSAEKRMLFIK